MSTWLAGREPALIGMLIGIGIRLIGTALDLSTSHQALINAAVAAIVGLIVATVTRDGQSAALLGGAQALIAVALGFGLAIDPDTQALIMSGVAALSAMYERTQITAPAAPEPGA